MKQRVTVVGLLSLSAVMVGVANAAPASPAANVSKSGVRVVAKAKALTTGEKASITGMGDCCYCGCPETPPAPTDHKPGYGFGTTGHYGPPGQDFTPEQSWRRWVAAGNTVSTPAGHPLPGQALTRP